MAFRGVAAMGLLGVGLTACQWVAGIEDIELTSGSSAAGSSSGAGTGGTHGASSSSSSSSTTASSSASGAGGAGPTTVKYTATVADCVNINNPNPDTCESECGAGQMRIDTDDTITGSPYHAFLRFDLDNVLAGRTVVAVTLYLTTTTHADASSDKSGEIWEMMPFDRGNLSVTPLPSVVGSKPIAGDRGGVKGSTTYDWPLPIALVAPNKPVYLGLVPKSTNPPRYWNTKGTTTPELVIDLQ